MAGRKRHPLQHRVHQGGQVETDATEKNISVFLDTLAEQWEELPPHFVTSSENRTGREEVLDYIDSINESLKRKD